MCGTGFVVAPACVVDGLVDCATCWLYSPDGAYEYEAGAFWLVDQNA